MLKRNLISNFIGQGWRVFMGLIFIPLYINYLGVEAYGLVGLYAVLQMVLGLVENGLNPAIGREMARFTGDGHNAQTIGNLLRTIEIIILSLATIVALGIWSTSYWLASDWLKSENIPVGNIAQAFSIMGFVIGLRFIENIYSSSICGLQHQVTYNIVISIMATARGLGAVAILAWLSPTIEAFFLWQGFISILTIFWLAVLVYKILPIPPCRAKFSIPALEAV